MRTGTVARLGAPTFACAENRYGTFACAADRGKWRSDEGEGPATEGCFAAQRRIKQSSVNRGAGVPATRGRSMRTHRSSAIALRCGAC